MDNPAWYDELASLLKKHFDDTEKKSVDGEQFLRNYLVDNPLESFTEEDEDQIVDKYLDHFQNYLLQFPWVKVDQSAYRWINELAKIDTKVSSVGENDIPACDVIRLQQILDKDTKLEVADIEWAKQELLIEKCNFSNVEALAYKLAHEISHHTNFTLEDRYKAWLFAAYKSHSTVKYIECMELASDCKASLFKFDEAANTLKQAIFRLDKSLEVGGEDRWINSCIKRIKRRLLLSFRPTKSTDDELLLRLIRKCRVYYEQAGNREMSSKLFVIETDVVYRTKNFVVKSVMLLYWLFSKYGESPVRVLSTSLAIILLWALIYQAMGICCNLDADKGTLELFETNVYFSVVTFTTLGYGDFSPPINGRLLASVQAMLGLFMTSLFLVTFVRKYSR